MKPTLLLSDLHLAPERPGRRPRFEAFARGPARAAAAVYIMGDLFDAWIGDEQRVEPFARDVVGALRGISDAGVPLYVARGNRDFLLGDAFRRRPRAPRCCPSRRSSTSAARRRCCRTATSSAPTTSNTSAIAR